MYRSPGWGGTMTVPKNNDGPVGADDALARLMDGNARFLRGEPRYTRTPMEVLAELAKGQRPFATILGCSDSRVPPELVFDAGFGDLFIIRVAGHVVSPEVAGSLQYAGTHGRGPHEGGGGGVRHHDRTGTPARVAYVR